MPNRLTHTWAGAATGVGIAFLDARVMALEPSDRIAFMAGSGLGGAVGGRLPDILEPATSPQHRQFCHGILPCGAAAWLAKDALIKLVDDLLEKASQAPRAEQLSPNSLPLERWALFFLAGFIKGLVAGYASHLVLDGCSPCGLPVIGKLN